MNRLLVFLGLIALICCNDAQISNDKNIIKPSIEKDISYTTKNLAFLDQNRDKVWYEGDKKYYGLWLEGAKQELNGEFKASIKSYLDASRVRLYEESTYDVYLPLGRAYLQDGNKIKAISALRYFKAEANNVISHDREWTLTAEGKENLKKKIELCNQLLSLIKSN